jgi:hypothetical protein
VRGCQAAGVDGHGYASTSALSLPASTAHIVVAGDAWLIRDRHQVRWLFDGDPAWLGNPHRQ